MERLLSLSPLPEQATILAETLQAYRSFLEWLSREAGDPREISSDLVVLHRTWYASSRAAHPALPSQMILLGIKDWSQSGASDTLDFQGVPYDSRLYAIKGLETVALSTIAGRQTILCVPGFYGPGPLKPGFGRLILDPASRWLFRVGVPDETLLLHQRRRHMNTDPLLLRVGRLIAGLAHKAVDDAEQTNSGVTISMSIRQIESAMDEVRTQLACEIAELTNVKHRDKELEVEHATREQQIMTALAHGEDAPAKAGAARLIDIEQQRETLRALTGQVEGRVDALRQMMATIEATLREAQERQSRHLRAQRAASDLTSAASSVAQPKPHPVTAAQRAAATIARVDGAGIEVRSPEANPVDLRALEDLHRQSKIDERLAALKIRTGGSMPQNESL
jgi:phage shock protein A